MGSIKIQFSNVGRYKKSWEAEIKTFDWDSLYKQVKTNGELMSRDVDFDFDEKSGEGEIFVGHRVIGTFKVLAEEESNGKL